MKRVDNRGALSEAYIAGLASRDGEYAVWDRAQPAFGVRVYPTGHKAYVVRKRTTDEQLTLLLGRTDAVPLAVARQEARRLIVEIGDGDDLASAVRARRATPTFEALLEEFEARVGVRWKASTWVAHRKYVKAWIRPEFAGAFVDEIDACRVLAWFERVTRTSPGGANRSLTILAAMMEKAIVWGQLRTANPCAGTKPNPKRKIVRYLSDDEHARLGRVLDEFGRRWPVQTAYVRFVLLTGILKSEPLGLTWRRVSASRVKLEDSKTGPRMVQLGPEAADVLASLERGRPDDPVFEVRGEGLKVTAVRWFWAKVCRAAELPDLRLHDLRHNYASQAVMSGETLGSVSKMLGHGSICTTARYAHLDDGALLASAEVVGNALAEMLAC